MNPKIFSNAPSAALLWPLLAGAAMAETPPQTGVPPAYPNFAAIVGESGPAVVNIAVERKRQETGRETPEPDRRDPSEEFFRRFHPPGVPRGTPSMGNGSGFVVREDGVVLTNAHVVEDALEVTVKLTDRREFKAKVVGTDKAADTAVLKIEAAGLPTVRLGDPSRAGVGDWVLAIGSPFGFENSVTAGIVSAKSRSLPDESYIPFIQTDVAVNPGNSGGPLFNLNGEAIGINSQIYTHSGGYQGVSFAIPIDIAMKVAQQLLNGGKVSRGRLGVGIQDLNQQLALSFGLEKPAGALVSSVPADGPASKAGIKPGDIILGLNGVDIRYSGQLPPAVADLKPGSDANLSVWRNGQRQEIRVSVGEAPAEVSVAGPAEDPGQGRFGLAVRPADPETLGPGEAGGGLLVERVSGAAARAGLRPGDVLLAVNGQAVTTPEALKELAAKVEKRAALLIQRGAARLFVPIELG